MLKYNIPGFHMISNLPYIIRRKMNSAIDTAFLIYQ
jgi:hypothetical protein